MYLSYNLQGYIQKNKTKKCLCDFILIQIFTPGVLEWYCFRKKDYSVFKDPSALKPVKGLGGLGI